MLPKQFDLKLICAGTYESEKDSCQVQLKLFKFHFLIKLTYSFC